MIGRIRQHWPSTHITIRGDGHYGREEAMTWCENYGIDYIFGLSGNVVLDRLVDAAADDIRVRRAVNQAEVLRGFAETRYAAKSWDKERRVVARIEASLDSRAKCNRALCEPDLHVFAKLFEDCLKRSLEAKAFSGREIGGDDDVLDFFVGHLVDVDLTRQPAA